MSTIFKDERITDKLKEIFPTLTDEQKQRILGSVFSHKDFETGEDLGQYRDFGEGYTGQTAEALRRNSESFRSWYRDQNPLPEEGTPVEISTIDGYTGITIGGRFLKDYKAQYDDAMARGDAEMAEKIKKLLIAAYEWLAENMNELIEENLNAASVANRTTEEDEAIRDR